jgi:prepilin-type N-terminal cleavage/methylation domain-containing protein
MQQRRGVTLIETVVAMSMLVVLATLAVTTVFLLMRAEAGGARALTASTGVSRLADAFRQDVHAAASATVENDENGKPQLRLAADGTAATLYSASDRTVRRIVKNGDDVTGSDSYTLPVGEVRFEVHPQQKLVSLVLQRTPETRSSKRPDTPEASAKAQPALSQFRIEAALGRDVRFETSATKRGKTESESE